MTTPRDPDRIIRAFLDEGLTDLPDRTYDAVRSEIDRTRQRVAIDPGRLFDIMNTYLKLGIAAAAVVVIAIVGINLVGGRGIGGPAATPTPSPSPSVLPSTTPSPSTAALAWPRGSLASGPVSANLTLCDPHGTPCDKRRLAFTFDLPTSGWSADFDGVIFRGTFPSADGAWVWMMGAIHSVSTDPCTGVTMPAGSSIVDMATAVTKIPGTDASEPTDVSIGGRPGKEVVLTLHPDIPCAIDKFWLFGDGSLYPNTLQSIIKVRFVDLGGGRTFTFYSDQDQPNDALDREIQQIADSIKFE